MILSFFAAQVLSLNMRFLDLYVFFSSILLVVEFAFFLQRVEDRGNDRKV